MIKKIINSLKRKQNDNRQLSIGEKWALDIESYKKSSGILTAKPQCDSCTYRIKENVHNCQIYDGTEKPQSVVFAEKECLHFKSSEPLLLTPQAEDQNRFYGGIFGAVIGNTLSVPVFNYSKNEIDEDPVHELRAYGKYNRRPFGSWDNDVSLMLCLVDAIPQYDILTAMANNMVSYLRNNDYTADERGFSGGRVTYQAIERIERGECPLSECGFLDESAIEDGLILKTLPLAYLNYQSESEFIRFVENVSSLTHAQPKVKLVCILYVNIALKLYQGADKDTAINSAVSFIKGIHDEQYSEAKEYFNRILTLSFLNNDKLPEYRYDAARVKTHLSEVIETVLWIFYHTDTYKEAVLYAVNIAKGSTTITALVGGLSGTYYGYDGLVDRWVQNILKKNDIYRSSKECIEFAERNIM